jgi:hypothetical protein
LSIETFVNLANALGASADELFAENLVFYQLNSTGNEFTDVLADCNAYERRVIIESAKETKRILRANRYLLPKTSTKPL